MRKAPASRPDRVLMGTNNGLFGTEPNGEEIALSGFGAANVRADTAEEPQRHILS